MNEEGAKAAGANEVKLSEHLLAMASMSAHFVAVAEQARVGSAKINEHLAALARETGLEFWITDEHGYAYLRSSLDVRFRFSPDPAVHPQASAFWAVLTGERSSFVQEPQVREIDSRVFQYAAVGGIDKARIVQVGREVLPA
jgi:phosphoserine phosphatase RsbU/P